MPHWIVGLFAMELALGGLFLMDRTVGSPFWQLHIWLDFEHEGAFATWFSTVQLFSVALLLGCVAWGLRENGERDLMVLAAPPLLFAFLSMDEAIQIHEWLGYKMFPAERRADSVFGYVGIWGFVLGPILLLALGWIGWRGRRHLASDPAVRRRLVAGVLVFVGAGAFVEQLANFAPGGSLALTIQVFSEEVGEMAGVTLILWACWDLARQHAEPHLARHLAMRS